MGTDTDRLRRPLRLLVLLLVASCGDDPTRPPSDEAEALATAGRSFGQISGMRSFIVSREGEVLFERYYNGARADEPFHVRSVTKSVTSTLVGIALEDGLLDLDVTVGAHLPEDLMDGLDPAKAGITVRDLLRMAHGFQWNQLRGGNDFNEWALAEDQLGFVLERPLVTTPGATFEYSDGAVHMLSVVLDGVTGMTLAEYADTRLFGPMGFGDADRPWSEDNRGFSAGGVGLHVTPREMLAFGELYLNQGVHEDVRLVEQSWIEAATSPQIDGQDIPFSRDYGYLWWVGSGGPFPFYYANGFGGQFIVVAPDRGLVVITTIGVPTDGSSTSSGNWDRAIRIIVGEVLTLF